MKIITGELEPEKVRGAIHHYQTKYCSVSAILSKAAPISYTIFLNEESIGSGKSQL